MGQYTWEQRANTEHSLRSRLQQQQEKKTTTSPREDEKQQNALGKITTDLNTEKKKKNA